MKCRSLEDTLIRRNIKETYFEDKFKLTISNRWKFLSCIISIISKKYLSLSLSFGFSICTFIKRFIKYSFSLFHLFRTFQLFSLARLMIFPRNLLLKNSFYILYTLWIFSFFPSSTFITTTVPEIIYTFSF